MISGREQRIPTSNQKHWILVFFFHFLPFLSHQCMDSFRKTPLAKLHFNFIFIFHSGETKIKNKCIYARRYEIVTKSPVIATSF